MVIHRTILESFAEANRVYEYIVSLETKGRKLAPVKEVAKKLNVTERSVEKAVYRRKCERLNPVIDPDTLSLSQRDKVEAVLRVARKNLEKEYQSRVDLEAKKMVETIVIPAYSETIEKAKRIIATGSGVMPRSEFRKILAALHPDANTEERRDEAFNLFKQYEFTLVKEKVDLGTLPRTVEELMKRRVKS